MFNMFDVSSYVHVGFWGFFEVFFRRLFSFSCFSGGLASDELQIAALCLLGISSSFLGSLLYLHRSTMMANTISHTSLLGIVFGILVSRSMGNECLLEQGFAMDSIVMGAFVSSGLTSLFTYLFRFRFSIRIDASIALVFASLSALGMTAVSMLFGRAHVGLDLIVGDLDLVTMGDMRVLFLSTFANVVLCLLLRRGYFAIIFDKEAASCYFPYVGYLQFFLLFQVAMTMMASLRPMGLFLPLAYLVGIPLWARFYSNNISDMWKWGTLLSFGLSVCAVALTRSCLTTWNVDLSSGGISILCLLGTHIIALRKKDSRSVYSANGMENSG